MFSILAYARKLIESSHFRWWLPGVVLIAGVTLSVSIFWVLQEHRQRNIALRAKGSAEHLIADLHSRLLLTFNDVNVINAFYSSSEKVTPAEFQTFSGSLREDHPWVKCMFWAPVVPGDKRAQFVAHTGRERGAPFQIRQLDKSGYLVTATARRQYMPIRDLNGVIGYHRLVGLDLATVPEFAPAIAKADKSNQVVVTAPMRWPSMRLGGDPVVGAIVRLSGAHGPEPAGTPRQGGFVGCLLQLKSVLTGFTAIPPR